MRIKCYDEINKYIDPLGSYDKPQARDY